MKTGTDIYKIIEDTVIECMKNLSYRMPVIAVGISNRHIHLSRKDINVLFGEGYLLAKLKDLTQTGQYAAKETVTLIGLKGIIDGVRVLGPEREQTQVEILMSDTYKLGIRAPVRNSGDIKGTPGITLSGPKGAIRISEGVIVAKRHIHMNKSEAEMNGLADKDKVSIITRGERGLEFKNVLVRVDPSFRSEFHIDTDEANAADLVPGDIVEIIKQS